jgi:hypothetical protein
MRAEDLVRRACETFARKLPTWIITVAEDDPYLARHYLFKKDWIPATLKPLLWWVPSVFVHEFKRGDSDREYHNHPWKFSFSMILAGGYTEERLVPKFDGGYHIVTRTYRPGMLNTIRANDYHRVGLLDGKTTWTLFVAGERTGDLWGFMDVNTREFMTWKEHLRRRERSANGYHAPGTPERAE